MSREGCQPVIIGHAESIGAGSGRSSSGFDMKGLEEVVYPHWQATKSIHHRDGDAIWPFTDNQITLLQVILQGMAHLAMTADALGLSAAIP